MDYEKLYKNALERARDLTTRQNPPAFDKDLISLVFPELKESDEKVREDIISLVNEFWERIGSINPEYSSRSRMIAWLEKQGKKNIKEIKD